MTTFEVLQQRKEAIKEKLRNIKLPNENTTPLFVQVGAKLNCSGVTVKNYVYGQVKDGYLAEAIYAEFKILKMCK